MAAVLACASVAACSGFTSATPQFSGDDGGNPDEMAEAGETDALVPDAAGPPFDASAKRPPFYKSSVDTSSGCPNERGPKMVLTNGRCVDTTEISAAQYAAAVHTDLNSVPRYSYCEKSLATEPPSADDLPVTNITWCDASAYCSWAGKHLCTALEKTVAVCNAHPPDPFTECNIKRGGAGAAPRAVTTGCRNSEGVVNAIGNVQEFIDKLDPESNGTAFWGGGDSYTGSFGNICDALFDKFGPFDGTVAAKSPAIGFRCCADPSN